MAKDLTLTRQGELMPEIAEVDPAWPLVFELAKTIVEHPDGVREIGRKPTDAERREIAAFMDRQHLRLRPAAHAKAEKDRALAAIALMLGAFPSLRSGDVAGLCAAYLLDFQDFPLWAIERACEDVRKGRVKGFEVDYPPASPKVRRLIDDYAASEHMKLLCARRVMTTNRVVKVVSPEEQERIAQRIRDTAAKWRAEAEERRATDREERLAKDPKSAKLRERSDELLERAWRAVGREPPRDRDGRITASPSLTLNIEERCLDGISTTHTERT